MESYIDARLGLSLAVTRWAAAHKLTFSEAIDFMKKETMVLSRAAEVVGFETVMLREEQSRDER